MSLEALGPEHGSASENNLLLFLFIESTTKLEVKNPSHVYTGSSRSLAVLSLLIVLIMGLSMPARGEPPVEDPSKSPPQAYLLPMDIEKIQNTALAELLKVRPELKADDLKVSQLVYMLTPDPDFAIQVEKDGTQKRFI